MTPGIFLDGISADKTSFTSIRRHFDSASLKCHEFLKKLLKFSIKEYSVLSDNLYPKLFRYASAVSETAFPAGELTNAILAEHTRGERQWTKCASEQDDPHHPSWQPRRTERAATPLDTLWCHQGRSRTLHWNSGQLRQPLPPTLT